MLQVKDLLPFLARTDQFQKALNAQRHMLEVLRGVIAELLQKGEDCGEIELQGALAVAVAIGGATFESIMVIIPKLQGRRERFLEVFKRATSVRFNPVIAEWLHVKYAHISARTPEFCAALAESFPAYLERHSTVLDLHVCGSCID